MQIVSLRSICQRWKRVAVVSHQRCFVFQSRFYCRIWSKKEQRKEWFADAAGFDRVFNWSLRVFGNSSVVSSFSLSLLSDPSGYLSELEFVPIVLHRFWMQRVSLRRKGELRAVGITNERSYECESCKHDLQSTKIKHHFDEWPLWYLMFERLFD